MSTMLTTWTAPDALFRSFFGPSAVTSNESGPVTLRPRVDIQETEQAYVIEADLPGVRKEDVNVEMERGSLRIEATRKIHHQETTPIHRERYSESRFVRSFHLGEDLDAEKISGELKDGVLVLTVPKKEKALPRRIEVK